MKCPDKATWSMRVPEYIEQLISPTLLRHHNITSQTPIINANSAPLECSYMSINSEDMRNPKEKWPPIKVTHTPVLEVPFDTTGQFVRAILASYNLPSSSIKENKKVLEAFCSLTQIKIVYLPRKNDVVEKKDKTSNAVQKTIRIKKNKAVETKETTE